MKKRTDEEAFLDWLKQGLKETLQYRAKKEWKKLISFSAVKQKKITPHRVIHAGMKRALEKAGFQFEEIRFGDSKFLICRKTRSKPGKKVLVVPGLGDAPSSWLPTFFSLWWDPRLELSEIVLVDFPGYFGFLSTDPICPSMEILHQAVFQVMNQVKPDVVIGHSLGGWLSASVLQKKEIPTVKQLVLIAPSGLIEPEERNHFESYFRTLKDKDIAHVIRDMVYDPSKIQEFFMKKWAPEFFGREELQSFIDSVKEEHFVHETVQFQSKVEIDLIWGEGDRCVPVTWLRPWVERFGDQVRVALLLKKTGHIPQIEKPWILFQALSKSLVDVDPMPPSHWNSKHWGVVHRSRKTRTSPLSRRSVSFLFESPASSEKKDPNL